MTHCGVPSGALSSFGVATIEATRTHVRVTLSEKSPADAVTVSLPAACPV
jgi:hypothetical protein